MFSIALYNRRFDDPIVIDTDDSARFFPTFETFFYGKELTPEERGAMQSSPWMNREVLNREYLIIPKTIEHRHDLKDATDDKFAVVKLGDQEFVEMSKEDLGRFDNMLKIAMHPLERIKYAAKRDMDDYYGMMFQGYRKIYAPMSDEHIAKLRDALQNDLAKCQAWVDIIDKSFAEGAARDEDKDPFSAFLYLTAFSGAVDAAAECSDGNLDPCNNVYSLKHALEDPELTKELIRALEPKSIQIIRGNFQSD